jgi:hypothetical protein
MDPNSSSSALPSAGYASEPVVAGTSTRSPAGAPSSSRGLAGAPSSSSFPSSSPSLPLPLSPLSSEAVQTLLYRASREPISPELIAAVRSWMLSVEPAAVDAAYATLLGTLLAQAAAAKGPPGAASRAKEAALGLLGRRSTGPVADYPDVRLSHSVLHFGPEHARGERIPAPGAAASRPPPAIIAPPGAGAAGAAAAAAAAAAASQLPPPSTSPTLVPCPAHTQLTCALTLTNLGRARAVVSVRPLQSFTTGDVCLVSVEPATAVLERGKSATVAVTLRLLRPSVSNDAFIVVETAGGNRLLALARAVCERTVFGVALGDVPLTTSAGYEGIPVPLALMRDRLLADGGATLRTEGIFRVAPSNDEKAAVRSALNDGSFSLTSPPAASGIALAHMIKVFLRELPQPVLSAIPTETLLNAASEEDCIALIGWLVPPASVVFAWLVDLLIEVAKFEAWNKMGAKNLAICTGPNLFATDESVNPMEALMASQKAVNALFQVIQARAQAEARGGRDIFKEHLGLDVKTDQLLLLTMSGATVRVDGGGGGGASASASGARASIPAGLPSIVGGGHWTSAAQAGVGFAGSGDLAALALPARGSINALRTSGGAAERKEDGGAGGGEADGAGDGPGAGAGESSSSREGQAEAAPG